MQDKLQNEIHATAVIEDGAQLGEGVRVGPYCVVGGDVVLGDRVHLRSHVVVEGHTTLGDDCEVFPFASVGAPPQDRKYEGEPTKLIVGARTVIRECATLQPGTVASRGIGETRVGADCLLMAYVHVAHDCVVGDHVIIANASQLAGHVVIEDHVVFGGMTTVHQFVRVGTRAFTGARTHLVKDVPPYMMADGHPAHLFGLNKVGLERAGLDPQVIKALKDAYKAIFLRGAYAEGVQEASSSSVPEVERLARFLQASERGVTRPRNQRP